jgi:hypothetical protein
MSINSHENRLCAQLFAPKPLFSVVFSHINNTPIISAAHKPQLDILLGNFKKALDKGGLL